MIENQAFLKDTSNKELNIIRPGHLFGMQSSKWRKAIEKIDFLFLTLEALDVNTSQSFAPISRNLDLNEIFPNYVEIWKSRCHNPLRITSRNSSISMDSFEGLLRILSTMSNQAYPRIRELLSSKGSEQYSFEKWSKFSLRFDELISERMNVSRGSVVKYLTKASVSKTFHKQLLLTLALSSGIGGLNRLSSSIFEPLL